MNKAFLPALLVVALLGCTTSGPAISKSTMGNLEINVLVAETKAGDEAEGGEGLEQAKACLRLQQIEASLRHEVYIDEDFVGTATSAKPVLYLKRGEHVVRVECPGYRVYEKTIRILGEPNHQVLTVILEKE